MKLLIPLIFLFGFAYACPAEIDRTAGKYHASKYEVKLLHAIYKHEKCSRSGYCMAVLSPKYRGCERQVRQALKIIRQEWRKWDKQGRNGFYIYVLADRYCPAKYDYHGNRNWKKGITKLIRKREYD